LPDKVNLKMRRIALAFALCVALTAGPALAQTPPPVQNPPAQTPPQTPPPEPVPFPPEAKIGFVNLQAVVAESALGKSGSEQLKILTDRTTADLTSKQQEIQNLQNRINTQRELLTQAAVDSMIEELDLKQRQLQFDQENAQREIERLNTKLLQEFQVAVFPVVEEIRAEKGLLIILSIADSGVLAAHPGLDLSAEVVTRLDAKTSSGGGAPPGR
jgi:Skp family chaperone for outer membrane proteins